MTEVTLRRDDRELRVELCVKGHAGYAAVGRDIICSAVSILATVAAALALEYKRSGAEVDLHMEDGNVRVEVRCPDPASYERCGMQMRAVEVGYGLLAETYPEYISLNDSS